MKSVYSTKKLKEICDIKIGGTPRRGVDEYWKNGELPWVSIADMTRSGSIILETKENITEKGAKESNVKLVPKGSILFSFKLSIGKLAFAGFDLYTNEAIAGLIIKDPKELDKDFLFHYLSQMSFENTTSAVKGKTLNKTKIENLEIPLPPLNEQRWIVGLLEKKLRQVRKLIELREAALADTNKILSTRLHEIFTEGKAQGWEEVRLEEIVDIKRITNQKKLPYVGLEDIKYADPNFYGNMRAAEKKSRTFYFSKESVLYGRLRPYLNKVMLPDFEGHCSTEIFPLYPETEKLDRKYLWYWLIRDEFVEMAMKTITGSRMPRADMDKVITFKIPLPSLPTQSKIVAELDQLSATIDKLKNEQQAQLTDLQNLEKAYLREAFNGELA